MVDFIISKYRNIFMVHIGNLVWDVCNLGMRLINFVSCLLLVASSRKTLF